MLTNTAILYMLTNTAILLTNVDKYCYTLMLTNTAIL